MFRLDCIVIVTILLCWSHAHISKNVDFNLVSSGGHRLRPRSIIANETDIPVNKSALQERIGKPRGPTNQEEISDIFSGKVQHVSTRFQIGLPDEGSVGPGLMEGGGGGNSTLIKKDTVLDQKIASHIAVSATNATEIIGSKQETTKSDNNSSRPSVIDEIGSEPILDKLENGSNADNRTEDAKSSKIHARKGAENKKINARKGVDVNTTHARKGVVLDSDLTNKTSASSIASFPEHISTVIASTPATETHYSAKNVTNLPAFGNTTDTLTKSVSNSNISVKYSYISTISPTHNQPSPVTRLNDTSIDLTNRTLVPVDDTSKVPNDDSAKADGGIISSVPLQKKTSRPKPLITTDKSADIPVFQGRTPSQHDYVIPIVVAILAVPMVLVLLVYLYKKGSESWERRHYRRMDFLIDGIYND